MLNPAAFVSECRSLLFIEKGYHDYKTNISIVKQRYREGLEKQDNGINGMESSEEFFFIRHLSCHPVKDLVLLFS
jgi:hypothetical protein